MAGTDSSRFLREHAQFSTLIQNLQEAVLVENEMRQIVLTNQRFVDLFGIPATPHQMVGADCSNAAEESKGLFTDPSGFVRRIDDLLAARELVVDDQLEMTDGRYLTRDYIPVFDNGAYLGHLWVYRDVTDEVVARRRLEELALTDELTGLPNRRSVGITLSLELERLERAAAPLALAMADIDRFKPFNDSFGHQAGDAAIQAFASLLRSAVRRADVVGRYGGEEFIIVLPGCSREEAAVILERCRERVESSAWDHRQVTASFGYVVTSESVDPKQLLDRMNTLIGAADAALYRAKENGRNRVEFAQALDAGAGDAQR